MRQWVILLLIAFLSAGSAAAQEDKKTDDLKPADPDTGESTVEETTLGILPNPLERWGIKFAATYIGEVLGNPSGGLKQGDIYEGRLNLAVDVDLEKLAGIRQLAFHANLFQIHGGGLSRGALFNFMDVSGIEALPSTRLYEMWFEQKWGTKLALRAGQLAADTEFMTAKYTDVFTNASLGWPVGLSLNMPSGGPSPPLAALGARFRGMDKRTLHNTVRLLTGSAADFLDDYFESDILKGYLASSSIIGTKVGPYSQGSGLVLLYHSIGEHDGEFGAWAFHKRGNGGFTQVLARAARSFGAEIVLESPVAEVITRNGRATGVALVDGTEYHATTVVSALDPRRTFLELVDPRELPTDLVETITRFRFQGTSSKVNFALDGLPQHPALQGRGDQYRGFTNIGPSMEYLERAFDDAKYGWYSQRPYMDCAIQSTIDADMAPPGKHVMSTFIAYTPYKLRESDWDTERQNLGDTVQATFESFFPGFRDLVIHREVVTPLDIERTVGLSEGNIFAGEFLAPQMYFFRPAPGWSQYRTPIDGYYQCGSGTHPGGCVMGAPGKLAAERILKDRARA